jgi:hypothetical protein
MPSLTRGGLQPAKIINLQTNEEVSCMFNPFEYAIAKQNTWQSANVTGRNAPRLTFQQGGARTITLNLYFDTMAERTNVTSHTAKLWKMTMIDEGLTESQTTIGRPPDVAFKWGALYFRAIITQMTEAFSIFLPDGTPVRSKVTINLQERLPEDDVAAQTPDSGSATSPAPSTTATEGSRPDNMSSNPNDMRSTMAANNIDNPLNVPNGTVMQGR